MFAWNCGGSVSRYTRLHFSRFVAYKQSRSQSSCLPDLGCHASAWCIPEENPHHRRTEADADWSLVRPWTVDCRHGCWIVDQWRNKVKLRWDIFHSCYEPFLSDSDIERILNNRPTVAKVTVKIKVAQLFLTHSVYTDTGWERTTATNEAQSDAKQVTEHN